MDLGTFYREFQNPPQLASLTLDISSQSMADDLVTLSCLSTMSNKRKIATFGLCFFASAGLTSGETGGLWEKHRWVWRFCGHAPVDKEAKIERQFEKRWRLDTVVENPTLSHTIWHVCCKYFVSQMWQSVDVNSCSSHRCLVTAATL